MRLIFGILCLILSMAINFQFKCYKTQEILTPIPQPEIALIMSGEFRGIASDNYLIKASVFYSDKSNKMSSQESQWMAKVLYLSCYLDPQYFEPYWVAGVTLPWAGRIMEAKEILERGLIYIKDNWQIPFYLGFISFYFEHDNRAASKYLFDAAKLDGHPAYLPLLASRLALKVGKTEAAIDFIRAQINTARDETQRKMLKKRLKALENIRYLEKAVQVYTREHNKYPDNLEVLVKEKIIPTIPPDPYGGQFYITKDHRISTTSELR